MNKDILNKVDEIIDLVKKSEEYQKYLLLKEKMENNNELMTLIKKVKILQKDVVHHLDKKSELDNVMNELNSHPLYREYNNTLEDINNYYAIIESSINNYFNNVMNG